MNVQELYQKKLTTAAEAVKAVKSGDWVDYGWCTNHPYTLDKALAARQSELHSAALRLCHHAELQLRGQLRLAALLRKALAVRRIVLLVFLPAAARHDQNDQHHEQQDHK